jgi:hypothetical protein
VADSSLEEQGDVLHSKLDGLEIRPTKNLSDCRSRACEPPPEMTRQHFFAGKTSLVTSFFGRRARRVGHHYNIDSSDLGRFQAQAVSGCDLRFECD